MAFGTVVAHLFTSDADIPVSDAVVTFTRADPAGFVTLEAIRITDQNGQTTPVTIETPALSESQTPQSGIPWVNISITADHPGYGQTIIRDAQIFADVQTVQDVKLIPSDQFPEFLVRTNLYDIPPFDL